MAKRSVGCFSDAQLRELAEQPNTVVYQPTHDVVYEAWPAKRVRATVDTLYRNALQSATATKADLERLAQENDETRAFSQLYQTMYAKMTTPEFARDARNVKLVKDMIDMRAQVERGELSETRAKMQAADAALVDLAVRAKKAEAESKATTTVEEVDHA